MIQRKQTIFLLLSLIFTVLCLCMPIGSIEPKGMGVDAVIYNIGVKTSSGMSGSCWPLFALLIITCPLSLIAIFLYKKRMIQAKMCTWGIILDLAWCVYLVFCVMSQFPEMGKIHIDVAACFPLLSLILFAMARRGIIADEQLVRSEDRIR